MWHAPLAGRGHEADGVLWVGVDLGLEEGCDGVGLCAESVWVVVAIAHVLRVVDEDDGCFERHRGGGGKRL